MKKRSLIISLGISSAILIGGSLIIWNHESPNDPYRQKFVLKPDDSEIRQLGKEIYAKHCASCHGRFLQGQRDWQERGPDGRLPAPPHNESGHTWHHPDHMLFAITKYGPAAVIDNPDYPSDMPAYEGVLTDEEIIAVLSFIKSRWPENIQSRHDQIQKAVDQSNP